MRKTRKACFIGHPDYAVRHAVDTVLCNRCHAQKSRGARHATPCSIWGLARPIKEEDGKVLDTYPSVTIDICFGV